MTYSFSISNLELFCENSKKYIVSDSVKFHKAHFVFDSQWNGYTKTIIFKNSKTKEVINQTLLDPESPVCDIPWEVIDNEGYLIVCAYGILGTSEIYTVMPNPLPIVMSDKASGVNPADPTPSVYEQIIDMLSHIGGIYTLPTASNTVLGGIKIGNHLSIDSNGIMTVDRVSETIDGIMSSVDKIKLDNIEADANKYVLPTASDTVLGGIKIGTNLSIDVNGVVSSQDTTYNVATQTTNGLMSSVDKVKLDGVEENANNYSLPTASNSTLGGIKIGTNLSIDGNGVVSSQDTTYNVATQTTNGLMSSIDKTKLDGIIGDINATPNTYVIRDVNADINTNGIDFDLTPNPSTIPIGHLQWNPTYMTLSLGTKEDSTLELGQEIVFPIRNGSGSTMPNGTVCYWYEAIGASGRVRVAPFIANGTIMAERCLGIVTHNLITNEDGHSTWLGSVNGINTTGSLYGETWSDGDIIYASPTIAGGMTKVRPTYPNIVIRLGVVVLAHATQGQLATKTIIYPTADQVYVSDVNNYYASTDTNSIFDEIGNKLTTLFDDLPPAPFLTAKTGSAIPTLVTFSGNIKQYTFAVNNEIFGTSEVTHLYKNGTDLMPHIHWATNGTDTTNRYVKWEMEYSYAKLDGTFSTPTVISTEATIVANTGNRTHYMTDLPVISGTNITIGTYLCWRVRRIASVGTAPTSNPFGLALGIHVHQSVLK